MPEIGNLLFLVIWACLTTHPQNDSIYLKKPLTLIDRQKIKKKNFFLDAWIQSESKLSALWTWNVALFPIAQIYHNFNKSIIQHFGSSLFLSPGCKQTSILTINTIMLFSHHLSAHAKYQDSHVLPASPLQQTFNILWEPTFLRFKI